MNRTLETDFLAVHIRKQLLREETPWAGPNHYGVQGNAQNVGRPHRMLSVKILFFLWKKGRLKAAQAWFQIL